MPDNQKDALLSPISSLTDDEGNHYRVEGVFGEGIAGRTVRAVVESVGPKNQNLIPGTIVAIKCPKHFNALPETEKAALMREIDILAREGTLIATKSPGPGVTPNTPPAIATVPTAAKDTSSIKETGAHPEAGPPEVHSTTSAVATSGEKAKVLAKTAKEIAEEQEDVEQSVYLVMQPFPGKKLSDYMYTITTTGNTTHFQRNEAFTQQQRNNVCYNLIRDLYALQLLGIVHRDIKADNILYDERTGTAKIIDFGNAINLNTDYRPDDFSAPGFQYTPPEAQGRFGEIQNDYRTDNYTLAILLAAIQSSECYDDPNIDAEKYGNPYIAMNDVLDPAKPHAGMGSGLQKIIQHAANPDPNKRPENIGLADGISECPELKDLQESQLVIKKAIQMLIAETEKWQKEKLSEKDHQAYNQAFLIERMIADLKALQALSIKPDGFPANQEQKNEHIKKTIQRYRDIKTLPKSVQSILRGKKHLSTEDITKLENVLAKKQANIPYQMKMHDILTKHQDLTTIRLALQQLKKDLMKKSEKKAVPRELDSILIALEDLAMREARRIQAHRLDKIKAASHATSTNNPITSTASQLKPTMVSLARQQKILINDLIALANENRRPSESGTMLFQFSANYNEEGKKLLAICDQLRNLDELPANMANITQLFDDFTNHIASLPAGDQKKALSMQNEMLQQRFNELKHTLQEVQPKEGSTLDTRVIEKKNRLH